MDFAPLRQHLDQQLPAALELLRRMVGINSWTLNRDGVNEVGRITAEAFAPLGFAAERVPSTNPAYGDHLMLTRPGRSARVVALVSHLDTVFPPEEEARNQFHWRVEGDRIFGPGTHDIKGGSVMMWLTLSALRAWRPDAFDAVTWQLCWNSSEELLSHDFGERCRERFGPDPLAALVFEAEGREPGFHRLVTARKGRGTWRLRVSGRGAHAGVKHATGANAVVQLARCVERVAALTDYRRDLTFNVAAVSGGGGLNRVPHAAEAEGEFRAFTPEVYTAGKAALLALAGPGDVTSPADGYRCGVEVEILHESRPWPRNAGTDGLLALWQEAGELVGEPVRPEERGGISDGNFLWDALPTIDGLGPAGDNDHCSERSADGTKLPEFVLASSFVPKALLNTVALSRLTGRAG